MASYSPETQDIAHVIPFSLNREDYLGFFLKANARGSEFISFHLRRDDVLTEGELMRNVSMICDSISK
jgi:hypothetical protein